ncbi:hypothetical protein FSPOR_3980 [Fusarium sporotrichioides]|uniref:Uncharacterized protein n=1 Tax=Fusarium sporotrichioides TaxID=5514 RepID=A0A395SDR1_FUSSP|nr:hypothetical protein FSPOR_3980 [Fusarium sporotrichioides]
MQGSASFPAALGSNLWIASFLAKHRNDDDIYVRTQETRASQNEVKFQGLYQKATTELRSVFRSTKSSADSSPDVEQALKADPKNTPEQQEKSAWAILFDTKSGNKLHKRTRSAPTNHHVPHVLETIGEEQEDQESSTLNSLVKVAQECEKDPKTTTATPQQSNDRVSQNEDNASIHTTCTVIIRQATLNDIAEEARVNAENVQTSTSNDGRQSKTVSFDLRSSQESRKMPIECSGALLTPSMMNEWGITTPEPPKTERKTTSISSSILSFMGKIVRFGRTPSDKKAKKSRLEPRQEPSNRKKPGDRRPIIKWNLPQEDNAMGDLIRNFSGPPTPPDSNVDTDTPPPSAKYGRNISNVSAFDKSVEDLMPMPAKRPISGRLISDSESMPEFDDEIHNPRLRPKGKHVRQNANEDASTVMSDEEAHAYPVRETEEQAYERHQNCIQRLKEMYDRHGIDRTGKFSEWEPKQREAVEQRQVREMTEDFEQPPQEIQPGEKEENEPQLQEVSVSEKTADCSHDTQEQVNINKAPTIQESTDQEVTSPNGTAGVSIQEPHDEQPVEKPVEDEPNTAAALTSDTASTSTWDNNSDIPLPLGARLTEAAMVQHQNEEYSTFFKSLQKVREKSPDRFCGRQGSLGVRAWLDKAYEHEDEMEQDRVAIEFFHGAPSTAENEDDTLSDLGYYPTKAETLVALSHPDAPKIGGSTPEEAKKIWNDQLRSLNIATVAKEGLQAQVLSSLTRNELIEDELDRAERVTYLYFQKKKAQESDETRAVQIRHVRKVCREFEKALEEVQRRATLANKEAADANRCVRYLQRSYDEMEENIHRFTESLGYQRANNLVDAMELVKKTEREENINIRDVKRLDLAEPESPDSYGATEYCARQAEGDNNVGPEDPTDIFF